MKQLPFFAVREDLMLDKIKKVTDLLARQKHEIDGRWDQAAPLDQGAPPLWEAAQEGPR